jgi:hypothetical protein
MLCAQIEHQNQDAKQVNMDLTNTQRTQAKHSESTGFDATQQHKEIAR